MADTQIWTPEETSALDEFEERKLTKLAELEMLEAQEEINMIKAAEESLDKGEPVEPEPVIPFSARVGRGAEGFEKSIDRLLEGKENWLNPLREASELANEPYLDPYKAMIQTFGAIKRVFWDFSIPQEDVYIDNPREVLRKRLSKPVRDEQGIPDPEALLDSDMPRNIANTIAIKALATKYNLPVEKLNHLLRLRLGSTTDDGLITRKAKSFFQLIDNVACRLPTALAVTTYKNINSDDFEKLLTRPEGTDYFDKQDIDLQIKPLIPKIRNGSIDEITVNGQTVDVNANDTIDSIQNKAYRDFITDIFAMTENIGAESSADVGSMLVPIAGSARLIAKTFSKVASAARLPKIAVKLEKASKASGVNPFSKSATAVVNIGPIRRAMPEFAAKMEQNALAQTGDYLVTQLAVQPTLAALGAPEGQGWEAAQIAGIMATPLTLLGLPGTVMEAVESSKKLEANVPLLRAIHRTDSFRELPRILQKKMRDYEGGNAEAVFTQIKTLQDMSGGLRQSLSTQLKEMPSVAVEWRSEQSKLPEIREHIDRLYKQVGFDHTIVGREVDRALKELMEENTLSMHRQLGDPSAGETQKAETKKRVGGWNNYFTWLRQQPEVLNNPDQLIATMLKNKHPLAETLQKRLQKIEYGLAYERALDNLITAGLMDGKSLAYSMSLFNGGVFAKQDPILKEMYDLMQLDLQAASKNKPSIHAKDTLKNLLDSPDNVRDFLYAVENERAVLQRLHDSPRVYRQKTKEINEKTMLLRKELINLNRERNALSKQLEPMRKQYGKAKSDMQAAMDTIDQSIPIGLANSPDFQIARSMMAKSIEMDLPIDAGVITKLEGLVAEADAGREGIQKLTTAMKEYNSYNKESQQFKNRYDLAVSKFMEMSDALQTSDDSMDIKFAYVLRGLVEEESEPKGQFHGTSQEIREWCKDYVSPGPMHFGKGFYTTETLNVAKNYKNKNSEIYKLDPANAVVYRVTEKTPVKFVDLTRKLNSDVLEVLETWASDTDVARIGVDERADLKEMLGLLTKGEITSDVLFVSIDKRIRERMYKDLQNKGYGGIQVMEVDPGNQGILDAPSGAPHITKIYWEPWNQIDIVPYSEAKLKVMPNTVDAYEAIQKFLYQENPRFMKVLDAVPEFTEAINKAADHVSRGELIPDELRNYIKTFVTDRNEARRIARSLGEARDDPAVVQKVLHDLRQIEGVLTTSEDVVVRGDALQTSDDSMDIKFAHVLRGLVGEEFEPKGQFHGTAEPIAGFHEDYYKSGQLYGQGFYTTDAMDIAKSYQGKNAKPPPANLPEPIAFTTSDGSTFTIDAFQSTVRRIDGKEVPSEATLYFKDDPRLLNTAADPNSPVKLPDNLEHRLIVWGRGDARPELANGKAQLVIVEKDTGKIKNQSIQPMEYSIKPEVGYFPVDLHSGGTTEKFRSFSRTVPSSPIAKIDYGIPIPKKTDRKTYKVVEKVPIKFYNLEKPMEPEIITHLSKQIGESFREILEDLKSDTDKTPSLADVLDVYRDEYFSSYDELTLDFTDALTKLGYGGFEHLGGKFTGKKEHWVKIYWRPWEQIDIVPYSTAKLKVMPDTLDAYEAIQKFLYQENPRFMKVLDAVPEFAEAINKAADHVSRGELIPDELRNYIKTFVTDRNEAKRIARALGEARDDSAVVQEVLHDLRQIEGVLTTSEDVVVRGVESFQKSVELIKQRKNNIEELIPRMRDLRKKYNSKEFFKDLKELDEKEVYPAFDKLAEGVYPEANERKLLYKYLTGTIGEQIYLRNHPSFMVTNRQKAEAILQAVQINSAAALQTLQKNFKETFGKEMNTASFISLFVNPMNMYNADGGVERILQLANLRRHSNVLATLAKNHLVNQEVGLDWIQDRTGLAAELAAAELPFLQQEGSRVGREWVIKMQSLFDEVVFEGLRYTNVRGKKNFVETLKRVNGLDGLPDHVITADMQGNPMLTPYGEIIYQWKVNNHGKSLEYTLKELGLDWVNDPERLKMLEDSKMYWTNAKGVGKREWALAFEFLKTAKKYDFDRMQAVNQVIRDMNARNGTSYPEYTFYPNRISVGLDTGVVSRIIHNTENMDALSFDVLFGRQISTSEAGQIAKLEGLSARKTLHPEMVLMNDTYKLFEEAHAQHTKRIFERNITRLNEMGYLLDATALLNHYAAGQSDTTIMRRAIPREIANAFTQVPVLGDLILWTRPVFNLMPMLAKLTSMTKNAAQMGQTAGENPFNKTNRWVALRTLTSPFTGIIRATKLGGFLTKPTDALINRVFIRAEPGAKWSYIEAGEGIAQRNLQGMQIVLGLSSMRARETVQRLTDRERNAAGLNKARTYEALPNFPGSGPYVRGLVAWNSAWDLTYDFTINLTKEAIEVNGAREAYIAAMHVYEQAMLVAQKTQDPLATMEVLIAPMAGLRNEAPYFSVANRLVKATKGDLDFDYLFKSDLPEQYAIMARNFWMSRFDHHSAPPLIKNLMRVFPKSGQFFSAQFNGLYRMLNASRKFSTLSYTHKAAAFMYMSSALSMVAMWELLREQTGIDVTQWSVQPQFQTVAGAVFGEKEDALKLIEQASMAKTDLYGVEMQVMSRAFFEFARAAYLATQDDTDENNVQMRESLFSGVDAMAKMTIYGLFADIVSSPVFATSIYMSDHLVKLEGEALRSSKEGPIRDEDRQITLAVDLMEILYGEGWKNHSSDPQWYEKSDAFMTLLSEHGLSPVLEYLNRLKRLDKERLVIPRKNAPPVNRYLLQDAWFDYIRQQAGKKYGRVQKEVKPKQITPGEPSF